MTNIRFKYILKQGCAWQNLEFLRLTRSHPDNVKFLFHTKQITRVEQEWWYENEYCKDDNYKIWIAYDERSNEQIAYVQYHIESLIHKRCTAGYVLSPLYSNSIYHKRILKWLVRNVKNWQFEIGNETEIHRLQMYIFPEDIIRLNNLTNNGWEIDGIMRNYVFKDQKFRDVYVLSTLIS